MTRAIAVMIGIAAVGLSGAAESRGQARTSRAAGSRSAVPMPADAQNRLVSANCATCHDDEAKTGGLSLQDFDAAKIEQNPELAEKMIRKLRAGMMPPPAVTDRPDAATLTAFAAALEARIDQSDAVHPNPGSRPFQRLNRTEYANAIRDLLTLDVDVTAFLPADTISHGFDNVADTQSFSPALLEGYLRAASRISRLAVGDRGATPSAATFSVPENESQLRHVEGAPYGTRGGVSAVHTFAADGDYVFKAELHRTSTGELFGNTMLSITRQNEPIDISVNGERVAVLDVSPKMSEADKNGLTLETPPIHIQAGPQRISAAFIQRFAGPIDDLLAPIDHTLADSRIGTGFGITALPHLQSVTVTGPFNVSGVSDTPARRRIFSCRPTTGGEEGACGAAILKRLATQAYRGPVGAEDFADLMRFYEQGRKDGDFESGIRLALQGILANPRFLFRVEQAPATLRAGQSYRLNDLDLASRLSFFLWDSVPDAELVKVAADGGLKTPAVLEQQVRRMLADPRSEALATRFAAQWLRLQDIDKMRPDSLLYPYWDLSLSYAFRRETELFFDSLVRQDRSLLDLLTADYSFVNERLARHYGIPNVTGDDFRRVTLPANRRGILTHGSILLLTSVADRTSPVQRGKWIMQVLFGTPPPPPPPNVPALEETRGAVGSRVLSVRQRMEEHRANPACTSCHRVIDPLGLALENYDVTGKWRIRDNGVPVDAAGVLYDGTKMDGPAGLRQGILKHSDMLLRSFTESLMTYGLGRRVEYYDMPTVRGIVRDAGNNGDRMSSFILGVINSPAFRLTQAQNVTTTTAGNQR
jgi:hypothetical protein